MPCYRICSLRGRQPTALHAVSDITWYLRIEWGSGDFTNAITSVAKDNLVFIEYD